MTSTIIDALSEYSPIPYFIEITAFLVSVLVITPLCRRIAVSPIIGFLCIGAIIGPHSMGLLQDIESVQHIAELGVIFLLFSIGLEISFERLKSAAHMIFGFGSVHFLLCAIAIGAVAWGWGNDVESSIVLGLCLALSSTAVVVQLLDEKKELSTQHGHATFSVLLFQDLMVVPLLIVVSIFGSQDDANVFTVIISALIKAIVAILIIVFAGRYVIRYVFHVAVGTNAVDVFMAATLLVILCTSAITGVAGLSMTLGAFLAGLLLAETEFRHRIELTVAPFKGLFLGLFFMGVGLNIDLPLAFEHGYWVFLSVIGIVAIKIVVGFVSALVFRFKLSDAIQTSFLLAQSGEFAFLVIGQASITYNLIRIDVGQFMVVVAGISMILTPLLAFCGKSIAEKHMTNLNVNASGQATDASATDLALSHDSTFQKNDQVVLIGYGRIGQTVANVLGKESIPYVAIDNDTSIVAKHPDLPVFHADSTDADALALLSIEHARCILITIDDISAAYDTTKNIRQKHTDTIIIVRSSGNDNGVHFAKDEATFVVPELFETSLKMASYVLQNCRYSREQADACIELVRQNITEESKSIG